MFCGTEFKFASLDQGKGDKKDWKKKNTDQQRIIAQYIETKKLTTTEAQPIP